MDTTKDKLGSMIKKWQSLIEAHVDIKTSDDYLLRIFVIAFTSKQRNQLKATSYANRSQQKLLRKKIIDTVRDFVQKNSLKKVV